MDSLLAIVNLPRTDIIYLFTSVDKILSAEY